MRDGNVDFYRDVDSDVTTISSAMHQARAPKQRKKRAGVRAKSIAVKRITKASLELGRLLYPPDEYERPKTRGECKSFERPCPFVSCRHHLYLDVNPETGTIKLNFPDLEVWEMGETCALDIADRGGITLEEVGEIMNLTRERIRQIEDEALKSLRGDCEKTKPQLKDFLIENVRLY
jgi:hypothetical protein